MEKRTYGVVVKAMKEKRGLNAQEICDMIDSLHGINGIPILLKGRSLYAIGFINQVDSEILANDGTERDLNDFIKDILDTGALYEDSEFTFDDGYNEIEICVAA